MKKLIATIIAVLLVASYVSYSTFQTASNGLIEKGESVHKTTLERRLRDAGL